LPSRPPAASFPDKARWCEQPRITFFARGSGHSFRAAGPLRNIASHSERTRFAPKLTVRHRKTDRTAARRAARTRCRTPRIAVETAGRWPR
jgi:hypothetical protein